MRMVAAVEYISVVYEITLVRCITFESFSYLFFSFFYCLKSVRRFDLKAYDDPAASPLKVQHLQDSFSYLFKR